jgi:hypothetical protein
MKVEQAKQIVSKAIEELSQSLERGHSETLRHYLAAIGRFRRYSLRNVMLIASQTPAATHVAGFHTWHKLGRFVKKGEKGILILAPIVRPKNRGFSPFLVNGVHIPYMARQNCVAIAASPRETQKCFKLKSSSLEIASLPWAHRTRLQQLLLLLLTNNVSNKSGNLLFAQSYPQCPENVGFLHSWCTVASTLAA